MTLSTSPTLLLLALTPSVLLIVIGAVSPIRSRVHRAIPATALATGIALLVLVLLVVGAYSLDALHGVADSQVALIGVPLVSYVIILGVLAHRGGVSVPSASACGLVGMIGLWYLGGIVLMLSACSFSLGGC